MKIESTLLINFILLSIYFAAGRYIHKCKHSEYVKPIKIQPQPNDHQSRQRILNVQQQDWKPIRIIPIFDQVDTFTSQNNALNKYIKRLVKISIQFYQEILAVKQEITNITLSDTKCQGYTVTNTTYNNPGVPYDLVIFITADKTQGSGVLASAAACQLSSSTKRPIFGTLNYNTATLENIDYSDQDFKDHLFTTMHEMLHILVFSPQLYEYFIDAQGQPINITNVYNNVTNIMITNTVKAQARDFFSCSTLDGMPIENDGGQGSAGAHWERSAVKNEIMTASSVTGDMYLSKFTLALLQDSGWYSVNIELGDIQQWGYKKGCNFISQACNSTNPIYPEFCVPTNSTQIISCNYEQVGFGQCGSETFTGKCSYWQIANHYLCTDPRNQKFSYTQVSGETYGRDSKCFGSNLHLKNGPSYGFNNKCYYSTCSADQRSINIQVGNQTVKCETDGQTINNINYYDGNLTCPSNISQFCQMNNYCPNNCNQFGLCLKGSCKCYQQSTLDSTTKTCKSSCTGNTFFDSALESCQNCTAPCATCKISNNICTSCNTGFYLLNSTCSSSCPLSTFTNNVTNSCDQTINGCSTYESSTKCKTCQLNLILTSDGTFCSTAQINNNQNNTNQTVNNSTTNNTKLTASLLATKVLIFIMITLLFVIA